MPLGTNQMTITTGANFIPEIWSQMIKRAVEENLVMAARVQRFDADVSQKGDTIHVPDLSNLTTNAKSANTQVTLQSPTENKTDILIDQHHEASFVVEDILKIQSAYELMRMYTDKAGYAVAHKVDTDLIGLYSSLSQIVGNGATALTEATLASGVALLDIANSPMTNRHLVIHPTAKKDLIQIANFVQAQTAGYSMGNNPRSPLLSGSFGELYGIEVSVSTQIVDLSSTDTAVDGLQNLLFHKEAFSLAMQATPRVQSDYILEYIGWLTVVDVLYGFKLFRDLFGVVVRSSE
jgi:N4-gp56 family major capsid protein